MKRRAQAVLDGFARLGIAPNPSSRLVRQANSYLDPKGVLPQVIQPDHPLFQTAVEGMRDLTQVAYILEKLSPVVPEDVLRSKLILLVEDSVLPQDSREHSPGRDFQCELFVAAICQRAGVFGELHEEPDIRCNVAAQTFGVAVKRIKTSDAFDRRFEKQFCEGVKQVAASGLPGVIAIDVTQSLNPSNVRINRAVTDAHFLGAAGRIMGNIEKRFRSRMLDWTKGSGVRGLILLDHHVRETAQGGWEPNANTYSINLCPYNERRRGEFESFDRMFGWAVRNP